jgi:hypothetical protein
MWLLYERPTLKGFLQNMHLSQRDLLLPLLTFGMELMLLLWFTCRNKGTMCEKEIQQVE